MITQPDPIKNPHIPVLTSMYVALRYVAWMKTKATGFHTPAHTPTYTHTHTHTHNLPCAVWCIQGSSLPSRLPSEFRERAIIIFRAIDIHCYRHCCYLGAAEEWHKEISPRLTLSAPIWSPPFLPLPPYSAVVWMKKSTFFFPLNLSVSCPRPVRLHLSVGCQV